jgi:methyl-accepting chemotaxis protein
VAASISQQSAVTGGITGQLGEIATAPEQVWSVSRDLSASQVAHASAAEQLRATAQDVTAAMDKLGTEIDVFFRQLGRAA